ncbi:MAG: hypothetical protein EXX96DRAFT_578876 [Benjaminiella poitrasii]|nr:MAG: hypothetical protein EXX96DRAFT_578876 [Benjaminiella poitrasii]
MCDTNWCTFCDCAVNPFSNSIYCSEDCFKRDALRYQFLFVTYTEEQQKQASLLRISAEHQEYTPSRRGSNDSVSSEELLAMHLDMIPSTPSPTPPPTKPNNTSCTAPTLSSSFSSSSSHTNQAITTPPLVNLSDNLLAFGKRSSSLTYALRNKNTL